MASSRASTVACATSASMSICSPISKRRVRSSKNGGPTTTSTDRTRASTGSHQPSSQHAPSRGKTGTDSPYERGQLGEQVTSDAETNGLPTFSYYGGLERRSVILVNDIEGYEAKAIIDKGTYLFAPSLWRAMINGLGAEVRPFHEDTDWIRSRVQERSSREWGPGTRLSAR